MTAPALACHYYAAGLCRSCTWLPMPRHSQVAAKQDTAARLVDAHRWLAPVVGPNAGFRTKAKMVAAGSAQRPTLGILAADGTGVDLQGCPLYPEEMRPVFAALAEFVTRADLTPYDVPTRRGELKHAMVTVSPDGEFMVRLVLRSTEPLARLRKHLPWLVASVPGVAVVTANILPEHKAVLEGEREIVLTERDTLPMRLGAADDPGSLTLHLRPQSFFQTNTGVAVTLYAQVAAWIDAAAPATVWDLYCGVGGFALRVLAPGRDVVGVELSEQAVESARHTARELAAAGRQGTARFVAADATRFALDAPHPPEAVIVNPPRRGIDAALATWLENSGVRTVVYSSCNVETLHRDLALMPSYRAQEAQVLDMFPHTAHFEVAVLLTRVGH